jgi:triphosphatase
MDPEQTAPTETELKLTLSREGVRGLLSHPLFRLPDGVRKHLVATYFDTPDHALTNQRMALRVRQIGDRFIQTLKTAGLRGVAASRGEWEWDVKDNTPDTTLLAQTPVVQALPQNLATTLQPAFATDVERTIWILHLDHGTTVEAALDEGKVCASGGEEQIRELELELRTGLRGPLYRLALELHANTPLEVGVESKGERGYRLLLGTEPVIEKAADIEIAPTATGAEAFRQIIESALGHLLVNRAASLAGQKEGIHQMRVAIRRLRAALVLFKPLLEPHARIRFDAEMRRIGRVFGAARDWDVFHTEVLPVAAQSSEAGGWSDLLAQPASLRRAAAHSEFAEECRGATFTSMVLGLAGWAEDGVAIPQLLGKKKLQKPIGELAPDLLDRLADRVDQRGHHISHLDDEEMHALRKSLKKLRYGIEFLETLFPADVRGPYQHHCKALQEVLGSINDTVMAVQCAEALANHAQVQLAPAIGMLAQQVEQQKQKSLAELDDAWKAFEAAPRFWG